MNKNVHLGTAIGFFLFAAVIMVQSLELQFYTNLGPGPGFFPFILSSIFAVLSLVWFMQSMRDTSSETKRRFLPDRAALLRIGVVIVAVSCAALVMDLIGYQLAMFIFLFVLIKFLGKQKYLVTTIVSLAGSVGIFHLFGKVLSLLLPTSTLPFLAVLGL